jgi:uncharacterized protein YqiB (DUF1249 family)
VRIDSYILPECIVRPGSFGGLMALYEANYIKLAQLIPNLDSLAGRVVSCSEDDCDLYLTIEERVRYTSMLRLTYHFPTDGDLVAEPDLLAKVYFDARMVEVQEWTPGHRDEMLAALDDRFNRPLDHCWVRNMMLSKWLDYLHDKGHRFLPESSISA